MRTVFVVAYALTAANLFTHYDPAEAAVRCAVIGVFLVAVYALARGCMALKRKIRR